MAHVHKMRLGSRPVFAVAVLQYDLLSNLNSDMAIE